MRYYYLLRKYYSNFFNSEKGELIEVFCQNPVPVYPKRGTQRLTANFGGSVPNLAAKPQAFLNNIRGTLIDIRYKEINCPVAANVENVINSQLPNQSSGSFSATTSPTRDSERPRQRPPRPPPPRTYSQATTSTEQHNSSEDSAFNNRNKPVSNKSCTLFVTFSQ